MSQSDILRFIEETELAPPRYVSMNKRGPRPTTDNKNEAKVVAGSVTAFTDNLKGQQKQDILDATLFAQLAADKKHDREKDPKGWYEYYKYVLGKIGFVIENFKFAEHSSGGASFTMDKVALTILTAIATGPAMAVVTTAITALGKLSDESNQIKLFSHNSSKSKLGNFQIAACDQSPGGDVVLAFGVFYFEANKQVTKFLFFTWGSQDVKLYKGDQKTVLNEEVYANVREAIKKKLGKSAKELVDDIDI